MKRTFSPPVRSDGTNGFSGIFNGFSQVNPPVITYTDLNYAYSSQNDLIFYSQEYSSVSMNIGTVNKVTPQQWVMPACTWDAIDSAIGVPVSQTPFFSYFPAATHCKLYEYPEDGEIYSFFEYYDLKPSGITLLGSVDDFQSTPKIVNSDLFIAPLNIDINFHLVTNDTIKYGTQTKVLSEIIDAEGFGTLTSPWGVMEVLKIVNHFNEFLYDNGSLIEELHQPVITFISKSGSSFDITLPEGSATTGMVSTEYAEFTRIVYDSFATVNNVTLASGTSNCYDAFQTITVAGTSGPFTVNSEGTATMISGNNIKYLTGTKIKSGAKMRGYITTNSQYCPVNYSYSNPWYRNPDPGNGPISVTGGDNTGKIRIFPVPASGTVTIQLSENEKTSLVKLELTDINGISQITENLNSLREYILPVENLPPGIYFLHASTSDWKETIKLVKR